MIIIHQFMGFIAREEEQCCRGTADENSLIKSSGKIVRWSRIMVISSK